MTGQGGGAVLGRVVREVCSDEVTFEQRAGAREWEPRAHLQEEASRSREQSKQRLQSRNMLSVSRNLKETG